MMIKSLTELRTEWRKAVWGQVKRHMPIMLVSVLLVAWAMRAMLPELPPDVKGSTLLAAFYLPFWARAALLVPYVCLMSVPLILAGVPPYPSRKRYLLNVKIQLARDAAKTRDAAAAD